MNITTTIVVNRTTSRIVRGPEWNGTLATTRALHVTVTLDPTIANVTIKIRTVTETMEEIATTIRSKEKDALIMKNTEMSGKQ